jgi:hypothetical protein
MLSLFYDEMILSATSAMIAISPIAISGLAFINNFNSQNRCDRLTFGKRFAAISIVPLIFIYADLSMFLSWPPLPVSLSPGILYLSVAALAYPLCRRVCQRNFDAGFPKYAVLLTFLPYLNVVFFIFLTLAPPNRKK